MGGAALNACVSSKNSGPQIDRCLIVGDVINAASRPRVGVQGERRFLGMKYESATHAAISLYVCLDKIERRTGVCECKFSTIKRSSGGSPPT